ncbi:glucose/quinate/shikimate family membrane-bound PQQ-dependent dehydrogenase [Carnimonas nigrificans]|uniref:glucose/quinate/shikimate family membrane-bound PQQ-dependent dehydrogenase n=1 Tax=Carnimonas nigrificans TaxID=64323 RepID=UPI00046FF49A|nr:glucose/quinate/shikimate family membrane-bound PQQ-dependent dehydrogenase [Carnimonas nigrificans]
MSSSPHSLPWRLPAFIAGAIIALLGLFLVIAGAWLMSLGGSWYYLIAGIFALASGIAVCRRKIIGLWIYALLLGGTLIWALWEAGLDWWSLVPRVAILCLFGIILLLLWWRQTLAPHRNSGNAVLSVAVIACAVVAVISQFKDQEAIQGKIPAQQDTREVPATEAAGDDWTSYGGTNAGTHYSSLKQITPDNISHLKEAWRIHTGDAPRPDAPPEITNQNTPLKVGDNLYICTSYSKAKSLDATSGQVNWTFDPKISTQGADNFSDWAHMTCRGLAYHDENAYADQNASNNTDQNAPQQCRQRLFLTTADARLIALDPKNGQRCADFGNNGEVDLTKNIGHFTPGGYYSTSPAITTRDLVIVGGHVTDNESTDEPSGVIRAYNVRTGQLVWNWDAGNPDATAPIAEDGTYSRNSANVWAPISVDEKLGLVYLPMGNQTPDQFGATRSPSNEKYSAGLVALDLATGKVRWNYQFVHHDLWDMDVPAQPVLTDVRTRDGMRQAVIQPTKQGSLFVLDRATGEPIVPIDELPAPQGTVPGDHSAPTQPRSQLNLIPPPLTEKSMWGASPIDQLMCRIKFKSLRYEGQFTPPSEQGSIVYPGNVGVFNWSGIAVDPARQAIFTSPNKLAFVSRMVNKEKLGGDLQGSASESGLQLNNGSPWAVELGPLMSMFGLPCQAPPWGDVAGIDMSSQSVTWKHRNGTTRDQTPVVQMPLGMGVPALGGPMTTAGGVSFLGGTLDYYLRAYDINTGEEIWKSRLPAGGNATPMTYMGKDGKQYVVITAGGHGTFGTKMGDYVIGYTLEDD